MIRFLFHKDFNFQAVYYLKPKVTDKE